MCFFYNIPNQKETSGYNHPSIQKVFQNPENLSQLVNRPALGVHPTPQFIKQINQTLMPIAPKGLEYVQPMMCGSCSNENAFKAICIWHANKNRNGKAFTEEELKSSLYNQAPGCPTVSIMSFEGGFHGRTFGALSCTHSKAIHKLDIPSFDWPIAPFPRYKYPLEENQRENQKEDEKCLARIEELFHEYKSKQNPVVGVVVEPIQSEGGDYHGSATFFQRLQKLIKKSQLVNRPALGVHPTPQFIKQINQTLLPIAPKGLEYIQPMMCGSCSNENAFKAICIWHANKNRDGKAFTEEELKSSLYNQAPGCPTVSIMSFEGGFHGRTFGALSCTHSKAIHKLDIPSFDWPIAPFPRYKYPLEENQRENQKEDERCLARIEELFHEYKSKQNPVVGVVVEPIQSEGGDYHGSATFFQRLQKLIKKNNAALLIDEVQTGLGATGKFWAHEHFNLPESPDLVSFSKKFQTGGYFAKSEFQPKQPYRIFNTWMGEPAKMLVLDAILKTVKQENLIENTKKTGDVLLTGLKNLNQKYPQLFYNIRGLGTFCAFDMPNASVRDKFLVQMRNAGIQMGACGDVAVRFRPALIFAEKHANIVLDKMNEVAKKF
ncbi:unnamed protein product [Adineta steineri]|uniref:4-aminobutyrate--2-oxoglutarate transaminase n=1 Tax=Adineta steineri TaxID=433720 RepID=A0A813YJ39_9BILA|nr:unnamed protein product [Adineta steineri]